MCFHLIRKQHSMCPSHEAQHYHQPSKQTETTTHSEFSTPLNATLHDVLPRVPILQNIAPPRYKVHTL